VRVHCGNRRDKITVQPSLSGSDAIMMLIGMFDSPFVRPIAISMKLFGMPFEHANWSVGKDFERILKHNPLGRVPALVLDDGEALVDSLAILDYLDEQAGPERALLPASGTERRTALRIVAVICGAMEKGRDQMYERLFKPQEKWHQPWIDRCNSQMHGALRDLEGIAAKRSDQPWLVGSRMTRADLMVACIYTLMSDALDPRLKQGLYPALQAQVQRCEALPQFQETYAPWTAPKT
jgi:glutathione S-transferase